jgi:RNA polymerase nonessential primary-like sigma factor
MPTKKPKQKPLITDGVRQYLCDIGRIPLLKPAEEIELSRQVVLLVRLQEIREVLQETLEREPSLEEWADAANMEQSELVRTERKGMKAKEKMVTSNLKLVVACAKKYQNRGLDFQQLIQEGNLGVQRAAEKFDPEKGYKFSTYAYWWIRQAITRAIATDSRSVRIPVHMTEKLNKIKKASRELASKLGRTPKATDIAEALGIKVEDVFEVLSHSRKVVSLSTPIGKDSETELMDLIPDEKDPVSPDLEEAAGVLLDNLTSREREVIQFRYFGREGEPMTLAEIGRILDLSRERVRQIENKALQKLKKTAYKKKIKLEDLV